MASPHLLRAKARKLRIDIEILQKQLALVNQCLEDSHTYVKGTCIGCQKEEN